ncbi:hypothetical protein [Nocardioides sp.]|uniref:hypothetical protein n=1 Tax=Nocardioides sp. TaxID=35761 RepID=UPI002B27AC3F|nr:hypothetical protein [Nocardioides sp.]
MRIHAPSSTEARPDDRADESPDQTTGRLFLARAWRSRVVLADAAVALTLLWWAVYLARGTGGREPHLLSYGCLLLAAAVVVVRPWRRLPTRALLLGHAVGAAAYGVVLLAPTGSAGADEAAAMVFTAEFLLVLVA